VRGAIAIAPRSETPAAKAVKRATSCAHLRHKSRSGSPKTDELKGDYAPLSGDLAYLRSYTIGIKCILIEAQFCETGLPPH
jgi:hypothetical protein